MPMTSHERVLRAIEHKETDRLPRDFQAESAIAEGLVKKLGLPGPAALGDYFKTDLAVTFASYNCPYTDGRNLFGLTFSQSRDGRTVHASSQPLANVETVEQVDAYAWPNPGWTDIEGVRRRALEARQSGRFVVCSSWGSIFGETYRLMGMDNFMAGLYTCPDAVHRIIRKLTDFFLEVDRRIFTACRGLIDMSYHGNDMGTQLSLLFSREMFGQFFAGPLKEMTDQARRFGLKTMMHSCGAVAEVMPEIIACGYDVLDPVQFTAHGMQPEVLKRRYGKEICFHGCISAQRVLPLGTVDEVRQHVTDVCRVMKPGGGYIFVSDQHITSDSPLENVLAMYQTIERLGW